MATPTLRPTRPNATMAAAIRRFMLVLHKSSLLEQALWHARFRNGDESAPDARPADLLASRRGLGARGWKLGVMNDRRPSRRVRRTKHRRLRRLHRHPGDDQCRAHTAVRTAGVERDEVRRIAARAVVARCAHRYVRLCGMRHRRRHRHGDDNEAQCQQRSQDGADKAHGRTLGRATSHGQFTALCWLPDLGWAPR